jgi:hypothetical protein
MLKATKLIIVFIFCFEIVKSQELDCSKFPTSSQLFQSLSGRPNGGGYLFQYRNECNINDSIRQRILHLLNWEWTKLEIEEYLKKYMEDRKSLFNIEGKAKEVSKGNDSLFKVSLDSIQSAVKSETLNEMHRNGIFAVPGRLFQIAGMLQIKEVIPILRKGLTDKQHYDSVYAELALARLGDKSLQLKIINSCTNKFPSDSVYNFENWYTYQVAPKLLYLATQESVYKLNEWLDTVNLYRSVVGRKPNTKWAYKVIADLKHLILNKDFQKIVKDFSDDWDITYNLDNGPILYCKNWLIKNRGKYKINRYYCPYMVIKKNM